MSRLIMILAVLCIALGANIGDSAAEYTSQMVLIPAGSFVMGDGTSVCGVNEREVTLTQGYYLGLHEVTNQEFVIALQWATDNGYVTATATSVSDNMDGSTVELVDLDGGYPGGQACEIVFDEQTGVFSLREAPMGLASGYSGGYDPTNHPVKEVSWYGAARFCDWLSMMEGLPRAYEHNGDWQCNWGDPYGAIGYRLPTDAEWEFAAQWDDERTYPWGEDPCTCDNCMAWNCTPHWTVPVGSYPAAPAALGLFDLMGNSAEWCNDWFECNLGTAPQVDPLGPQTGDMRVTRGGGWGTNHAFFSNAARHRLPPGDDWGDLGFRVVLSDAAEYGACCFPDGHCEFVQEVGCSTGSWSASEPCDPNPCPGGLYVPDGQVLWLGMAGEILIHAANNSELKGYSVACGVDPSVAEVIDLAIEGTRGEGAQQFIPGWLDGDIAAGVVYSYSCPPSIAPGDGPVLRILVQVPEDAPLGMIAVDLRDLAPALNRFTLCDGATEVPLLVSGQVEIRQREFVRGDVDANGEINISDPIYNLAYQFVPGSPAPDCMDAADDDDSGEINISDPIYSLHYQFGGGDPFPAPYPECGPDPTEDDLDCACFEPCGVACLVDGYLVAEEGGLSGEIFSETAGGIQFIPSATTEDGRIQVRLVVESSSDLLGLECRVAFDPASLQYAGFEPAPGKSFDFLSAGGNIDGGVVRIGALPDFTLEEPLRSGKHLLGTLTWNILPGNTASSTTLEVGNGLGVGWNLETVPVGEDREIVVTLTNGVEGGSGDDATVGLSPSVTLRNPYLIGSPIRLALQEAGSAEAAVYDVAGRRVRILYQGMVPAGGVQMSWDGQAENGEAVSTGVYYLRVTSGQTNLRSKIIIVN